MAQFRQAIEKIYYEDITEQAIREIASFGKNAVPNLIALMCQQKQWYPKPSQWWVRRNAARTLEQIGDPRAVGPLIFALADSSRDVQHAALAALQSFGTPEAVMARDAFERNLQHIREEQIFFVRAIRPEQNCWMAEAIFIGAGASEWFPDWKWASWRLGSQPQQMTCEMVTYAMIGLAKDREGIVMFSYIDDLRPAEEKQPNYRVLRSVSNLNKFAIEPMVSPEAIPFFLATVPGRSPCSYHVTVRLNFQTLGEYPDVQREASLERWVWHNIYRSKCLKKGILSDFQKKSLEMSPVQGMDLPVSVSCHDRLVTGVLRLKEVLKDKPVVVSENYLMGQTFMADLYLSDAVTDLAPGTALMRSVTWREGRTEKAIERQIGTILEAVPLPGV